MSDKNLEDSSSELLDAITKLKETETKSSESAEAVKAINTVSQVIDAIMAGRQLDVAFYGAYANGAIKRIRRSKKRRKKAEAKSLKTQQ